MVLGTETDLFLQMNSLLPSLTIYNLQSLTYFNNGKVHERETQEIEQILYRYFGIKSNRNTDYEDILKLNRLLYR